MRFGIGLSCAAVCVAACIAALTLKEDTPTASPPGKGDVAGAVTPAEKVQRLLAVSRVTGKTYHPKSFEKKTGKFVFKNLPGDATYDLVLRCRDGRSIEGIDLEFTDARLLRLAARRRKELRLPPEPPHKFSRRDAEELLKFVRDMKDFMEIRRVLYLQGQGRRATMLLELMRTREFYSSKGTVIWRVELWYFQRTGGGWEKLANQERVLRRERTTPQRWRKIHVEYYPRLSVYVDEKGRSEPVRFRIPEKPDTSRGRVAVTEPKLKTRPYILGLELQKPSTTSSASTRPSATRPATTRPTATQPAATRPSAKRQAD